MKIGIIGSGDMGRSLVILWAEQGHEVFFGNTSRWRSARTVFCRDAKVWWTDSSTMVG